MSAISDARWSATRRRRAAARGCVLLGLAAWIACRPALEERQQSTLLSAGTNAEPVLPIRAPEGLDPLKVSLGSRLFSDRRLSGDESVSCSSCHDLRRGGMDGRVVGVGIGGAEGNVNTLTVFNAALNIKQFWDGRADTLELQLTGPILSANEMGGSFPDIVRKLRGDADLRSLFEAAYPVGVTQESIQDVIATYERSLVTPDSRFDRYLLGDASTLSAQELEGYALFKRHGCVSCHQGRNVGGNLFERIGVFGNYFQERGGPLLPGDQGRFNVTRDEQDRFVFRVPSLRLASLTAPYFHDGRVPTLERAIVLMAKYQLGTELSSSDVQRIVSFLHSLVGTHAGESLVDAP